MLRHHIAPHPPLKRLPAQLCGTNYLPSLLKWVDKENLPEYLGGTSTATLLDDAGPWQDPQILSEINAELKTLQHTPVEETSHEGDPSGLRFRGQGSVSLQPPC